MSERIIIHVLGQREGRTIVIVEVLTAAVTAVVVVKVLAQPTACREKESGLVTATAYSSMPC